MTPTPDDQPASRGDMRRIHERLDSLTAMLHEKFATVADLADLKAAHRDDIARLQSQLDRHGEWFTWVTRIIVGAVILALLGLVITGRGASL